MPNEPILLSTWSFAIRGHQAAWSDLSNGGSSIDAVEAVCCALEADREVDSVGYGGLPDRDGAVTLDALVMLSPRRCGAVCAVRRHLHVVSIARRVMEKTPHILLAGEAADAFADAEGFAPQELLSPEARTRWQQWKQRPHAPDQSRDSGFVPVRPVDLGAGGQLFDLDAAAFSGHDTVCSLALDRAGVLAGAASTSGTPFKMAGRVGDVPLVGHGLYLDPAVGAATATGTGELVMSVCGSFLAVEMMRGGASPMDALRSVLERIAESHDLSPKDQVAMIAMNADGKWSSAALRPGYRTAVSSAGLNEAAAAEWVLLSDAE